MSIPPFTLYGLMGCPHCEAAEKFLKLRNLTYVAMWADGDPIIDAGAKLVLKTETPVYPILINRATQNGKISIVKGFKLETYERLAHVFYSLADASIPSIFGGGQQPVSTAPQAEPDLIDDTVPSGSKTVQ